MKTLKRFVLVGAPASGKGTQSSFLSETYGLKPLSTGALLRAEIAAGSQLGMEAKDAAMFVPDEVVNGIVAKWLGENKDCGCLLDGYPRTVAQAETLDTNLTQLGMEVDIVIYLNVALELIQARMLKRKACPKCGETTRNGEETCPKCGTPMIVRTDDNPEAFAKRWKDYESLTQPVIEHYRAQGKVVQIDVVEEGEPEDVSARIAAAVRAYCEK
ncbi:MAG: nucleoside monophosphate kinase [Akkermansia sp.]|nr:nucleoside monophosphate kinase [Akkermansia sp.]